ncbi:MAG: hypothetical protein M1127_03155 [Patescibacteria group bacterium]|nr:hypothetical protein [Patescibacteria group bacterium]
MAKTIIYSLAVLVMAVLVSTGMVMAKQARVDGQPVLQTADALSALADPPVCPCQKAGLACECTKNGQPCNCNGGGCACQSGCHASSLPNEPPAVQQ